MKIYSILYSLLTVASALPTSLFFADKKRHRLFKELDEKRLIIDRENKQRWISSVELKEMQSKCIPFMDITSFQYLSENVTKHQPSFPTQLYAGDVMKPFFSLISQKSMKSTMQTFTSFYNRHYRSQHGVDSTRWLLESVQELILEYRADQYVSISEFSHSSSKDLNGWTQPSLIARMERKESDTPDDVIIISAHLDSTAGMFGSAFKKAPGADDNASGSMTVLEVLRVLLAAQYQPTTRSIEFHWYAAEEAGLLGSQSVSAYYKQESIPVHSVYHIDMDGYVAPNTTPVIGLATDYTDESLTDFMKKIIEAYSKIEWKETKCGYACSDHASWTRAGIPSAFTMEGEFKDSNPYIHSDRDLMELLDFKHMKEYVKIALAYCYNLTQPK